MRVKYLKVDSELAERVGWDSAALYAFLRMRHSTLRRDDRGYFLMDAKYVERGIGMDRFRFMRCRNKLAREGLILCEYGANQNNKSRYKLL